MTVRVDVDRFSPQNRISIEVTRLFPRATAHAIAEVTSDTCRGLGHRRITAQVTYRDGDTALIPGDRVQFEASRGRGFKYGAYTLELSGEFTTVKSYSLDFQSKYFDPIEFEVDRVANAGTAVTTYDTGSHPNRPADLASETISLATVYQRAGFDVRMSPNTTVIPTADAGANGTWSDGEMHNAMATYWSRFANRPLWAMWVLFAARHDIGRNLGGIMFDDIGPNHRQGTAIFTDSFIQDAPSGDANAAAWRQRMVFWTATHEMGHAFNLAHAWQKSLGNPWIPLANEPESRSFMNYPFNVAGGQASFFSDFRFQFSDDELVFMRHAPRRFVQMGNSDWFTDHAFEAPGEVEKSDRWSFEIRPNREVNTYRFLEPVAMECKLTNIADQGALVDDHLLADGSAVTIFVLREGGETRQWHPLVRHCHEDHASPLKPGDSLYGTHTISATTDGWLIDESGFYTVQAAIDMGDEIVVSNVLRIYVAPPATTEEAALAPDYFTEDVARALVFGGAPSLTGAMDTLQEVAARCPENPARVHAKVAFSAPMLRDYKLIDVGADRSSLAIHSVDADIDAAGKVQTAALIEAPEVAAETLGHIDYFDALERLADAVKQEGEEDQAKRILKVSVKTMKKRGVIPTVVQATERKLTRME